MLASFNEASERVGRLNSSAWILISWSPRSDNYKVNLAAQVIPISSIVYCSFHWGSNLRVWVVKNRMPIPFSFSFFISSSEKLPHGCNSFISLRRAVLSIGALINLLLQICYLLKYLNAIILSFQFQVQLPVFSGNG
jgi:hypothetical protein